MSTARHYQSSEGIEKDQLTRLIAFGSRKHSYSFPSKDAEVSPIFDLTSFPYLLQHFVALTALSNDSKILQDTTKAVNFLRKWVVAAAANRYLDGALILYLDNGTIMVTDLFDMAAAGSQKGKRGKERDHRRDDSAVAFSKWPQNPRGERPNSSSQRQTVDPAGRLIWETAVSASGSSSDTNDSAVESMPARLQVPIRPGTNVKLAEYEFLYGDQRSAAIFGPVQLQTSSKSSSRRLKMKELLICLQKGYLSDRDIAILLKCSERSPSGKDYLAPLKMVAIAQKILLSIT